MSEILSNIIVEQTNLNFSPNNNNLNVTPEAIQLNVFTGAAPVAGGPNTSVQYSNGGVLEGSSSFTFDVGNGLVNTDKLETNILTVDNQSNLGNVGNVTITGGTNGYVLQTDGAGNLDWTAMTGGGGNGAPGGSNTQIQYNDAGVFGGSTGFTFNKTSNAVSMPGSLSVTNGIAGTLTTAAQPNITSLGTIASLAAGFISLSGNLNGNGTISALNFNGSGNLLTNLTGGNVVGAVANATYADNAGNATSANSAITAGTVTNNSQPNITSVGTLGNLVVSSNANVANLNATAVIVTANITSGNANLGNLAIANFLQGDGSLLSNINGANITGNLSIIANGTSNVSIPSANGNITFSVAGNANVATISNTTLTTNRLRVPSDSIVLGRNAASPTNEITGLINIGANAGNANGLGGRISIGEGVGNAVGGGLYSIGIGSEAAQNATANGSVMIGYRAGRTATAENSVYVGSSAGINTGSGFWSVAIGYNAKANGGGNTSIGIGAYAGANAGGNASIAIGTYAGREVQGIDSIAIGSEAGYTNQGNSAIAIGRAAGAAYGNVGGQQIDAIAIGSVAGRDNQGLGAIAIGSNAAIFNQGINSIAIGANAALPNAQPNNSIVLNATGANLNATIANSLFVKPIRDVTSEAGFTVALYYNPTTGEVGYK